MDPRPAAVSDVPTVTSTPFDPEYGVAPPDWWCYLHHAIETPSHPDEAWVCGECWHVYASKNDVVETERRLYADTPPDRTFEQIGSCPFCAHDW